MEATEDKEPDHLGLIIVVFACFDYGCLANALLKHADEVQLRIVMADVFCTENDVRDHENSEQTVDFELLSVSKAHKHVLHKISLGQLLEKQGLRDEELSLELNSNSLLEHLEGCLLVVHYHLFFLLLSLSSILWSFFNLIKVIFGLLWTTGVDEENIVA
jgi:hypothetical protein